MDKLSPSERRGTAAAFATACLAFCVWAFPNMSRIATIPGAIICACLTIYFLWPEMKAVASAVSRGRIIDRGIITVRKVAAVLVLIFLAGSLLAYAFKLGPPSFSRTDESSSTPNFPRPETTGQLQSTYRRAIFVCDKPAAKKKPTDAERDTALRQYASLMKEIFGVEVIYEFAENGTKLHFQKS